MERELRPRLLTKPYAIRWWWGTGERPEGDGAKVLSEGGEGTETFGHGSWDLGDGGQMGQPVGCIAYPGVRLRAWEAVVRWA